MSAEVPACQGKGELFIGIDVIDPETDLSIGQTYPYAEQAKALCSQCPVFDWCKETNWDDPYTIIAGKTPQERFPRRRRWE